MPTLRLLLFILVAALFAWFAIINWHWVPVNLPGGAELRVRLPALIFTALIVGALPGAILHSLSRWSWRRRLHTSERERAALLERVGSGSAAADRTEPVVTPPPPGL